MPQISARGPGLTPDDLPDPGILGAEAPHPDSAAAGAGDDASLIEGRDGVEEPDLMVVAPGLIAEHRVAGVVIPGDRAMALAGRRHHVRECHHCCLAGARGPVVAIVAEADDELLAREVAELGDLIAEPLP